MQSPMLFKSKKCFNVRGLAYLKTTLPLREVVDRVAVHLIPGDVSDKWEYREEEEFKIYLLKGVVGFDLDVTEDPEFEGCFVRIEMAKAFRALLFKQYGAVKPPEGRVSDFVFWMLQGIPDMEVVHYHDLFVEKEPCE